MGSDRARISFDPTREYRSVVAQQGRVTLEADVNEQAMIAAEALRLETIDIVGPAGTPNNGYQVTTDGNNNLTVGVGTMYVGGWRMENDTAIPVANQPEWLDQPAPAPAAATKNQKEVVALHVIEQSISAVEDQALLEVALGGPDTDARTRLMQHIVQFPTSESTCAAAGAAAIKQLSSEGLVFNPKDCSLSYNATLEVGFYPPTTPSDPCCPSAQGGYLGSDNQLVQVAVTSVSGNSGTLLWGWNNASFLYRATAVSATVLQLAQAPIDAAHTPQPGQTIEILQTTMVLGDPVDDNYVAAPQGVVVTLDSGNIYDPTTQQLTVPTGTTIPSDPNSLFVRLWQASVTFNVNQSTQLDTVSGLAVTINIAELPTAPFALRPFWNFAVRPNTPQQVYPARYLEGPQPPDGPRQWLCGLAIFTPGSPAGPVTPDCRIPFLPLTELGACDCCALTLDVSEDWQGKLNAAIASGARALNLCFQPGVYDVTSTISFGNAIVKITGAGDGTVIFGRPLEVAIEFNGCTQVTMTDVFVRAGLTGYTSSNNTKGLQGAVTFNNCSEINVDRCTFECVGNDLRSASCLAVYNNTTTATPTTLANETLVRITNCRCIVGDSQVGILLVNADHAWVENNIVETVYELLGITPGNIASHNVLASHLAKGLVKEMTIVDTATKTSKKALRQIRRAERRKQPDASHPAPASANAPLTNPAAGQAGEAPAAETTPAPAAPQKPASTAPAKNTQASATIAKLPHVNLGALGRAHVAATFGTIQLKFISSSKLTNAWTDALAKAGLTNTSTMGAVRKAVKTIALNAIKMSSTAPQAFQNYFARVLPQLYSTSSQGIVVGGNLATNIRIINNRIAGTAQGIHVGLCNMALDPSLVNLQVQQLRIVGNSIAVQMTPATTGDRHGIYVGGVTSALIAENDISLTRTADAGQTITGINVTRQLGARILIERNVVTGFTTGIDAWPGPGSITPSQNPLWLAAENYSDAANDIEDFTQSNNVS
ncbi:MAG TPA: DUF6519 domain-containing protein [Terracidiphilus sp.]|nr:DUF6519 domain-containing protein [Terracidiphilus sp.]